jgi:magnesium transporter
VTGLADTAVLAEIGRVFHLHALSLEDVLDAEQRAKVEHYQDYTFAVLKTLVMSERVESHQLNMFFGDGFVVTLQDVEQGALEPVRERLRNAHGKIRERGADYLAYALLDTVVDEYFPVVAAFEDYLEAVEDAVLEARSGDPIVLARRARQDLQTIRHAVWPARDAVASLMREESAFITDETRVHLRDCYDHVVHLLEMVEASREVAASLLEAYISKVSLQTNEVMRVLTLIATIFIPLTFITGVYGMNFNPHVSPYNMPELHWYWGYPFALVIMLLTAVATLLYFRRKGWLGKP